MVLGVPRIEGAYVQTWSELRTRNNATVKCGHLTARVPPTTGPNECKKAPCGELGSSGGGDGGSNVGDWLGMRTMHGEPLRPRGIGARGG